MLKILAKHLSWSALLLFGLSGFASELLIRDARVFDATDGRVIERADVRIRSGRIEAVSRTRLQANGAREIDAAGKTVLPGLINGHLHLMFDLYRTPRVLPTSDNQTKVFVEQTLPGLLAGHLERGFTTLVTPIDPLPYVVDLRERIAAGRLKGPRLVVACEVIMGPGEHYVCRTLSGKEQDWCDERAAIRVAGPDQARHAVQQLQRRGVDFVVYDGLTNKPEVSTQTVSAMVKEAHKHGLRVLVHNSDVKGAATMASAGVDGFVHPPSGGADGDRAFLATIAERRLPLAVTLGAAQRSIRMGRSSPAQADAYEATKANVEALLKLGAVPIFASDLPGIPPEEVIPMVVGVLQGVGLQPAQILLSATHDAARSLLGRSDLGTLEPGKVADLIMVDGDPLADLKALEAIKLVVKDGVVVVENP